MSRLEFVPLVLAVASALGLIGKALAVCPQRFERLALGLRHIRGDANRANNRVFAALLVKARVAGSARQTRQDRHAANDATDDRDVAVQLTRRVADHDIEFRAAATVRTVVTADT